MNQPTAELKPCPFEGVIKDAKHTLYINDELYEGFPQVRCSCGACGPLMAGTRESAIAGWDTRRHLIDKAEPVSGGVTAEELQDLVSIGFSETVGFDASTSPEEIRSSIIKQQTFHIAHEIMTHLECYPLGTVARLTADKKIAVTSLLSEQTAIVTAWSSKTKQLQAEVDRLNSADIEKGNQFVNATNIYRREIDRLNANNLTIGSWLSAALDDPTVCQEMKDDIRTWMGLINLPDAKPTETVRPGRDFLEDAHMENGNYQCICTTCKQSFKGHKRRITCKVCSNPKPTEVVGCGKGFRINGQGPWRCGHLGIWFCPDCQAKANSSETLTSSNPTKKVELPEVPYLTGLSNRDWATLVSRFLHAVKDRLETKNEV